MKAVWYLLLALRVVAQAATQAPPAPAADSLARPQLAQWPAATQARLIGRAGLADTARLRTLAGPGQPPALRLAALRRLGAVYRGPAGRGGWALARNPPRHHRAAGLCLRPGRCPQHPCGAVEPGAGEPRGPHRAGGPAHAAAGPVVIRRSCCNALP